jgi:hypothetical protein
MPNKPESRLPAQSVTNRTGYNYRALLRTVAVAVVILATIGSITGPVAGAWTTVISVDVDATPERPLPDENVTVNTTVENLIQDGEAATVYSVTVRNGTSLNSTIYNQIASYKTILENESAVFTPTVELDGTGEHQLYVHIRLAQAGGDVVRLVRPVTVTVSKPHPSLTLSGDAVETGGQTDLSLSVLNGNEEAIRGIDIKLQSDEMDLDESQLGVSSLTGGNKTSMTVTARNATAGKQTVTADVTYMTAAGRQRTVTQELSTRLESSGRPGNVTLTGLRLSPDGNSVVIRGSASNIGGTNVSGALIEVVRGDRAFPSRTQASYFVGEISESDYTSFEVHADVTGNETVDIPLQITYTVDDRQVQRTTTIAYDPQRSTASSESSTGGPPVALVGLGALLVTTAVVSYARYR